jgi:hypothetical protein
MIRVANGRELGKTVTDNKAGFYFESPRVVTKAFGVRCRCVCGACFYFIISYSNVNIDKAGKNKCMHELDIT